MPCATFTATFGLGLLGFGLGLIVSAVTLKACLLIKGRGNRNGGEKAQWESKLLR